MSKKIELLNFGFAIQTYKNVTQFINHSKWHVITIYQKPTPPKRKWAKICFIPKDSYMIIEKEFDLDKIAFSFELVV